MSDANWMHDRVRTFHHRMRQPAPTRYVGPLPPKRAAMRFRLILEEVLELAKALGYEVQSREYGDHHIEWAIRKVPTNPANEVEIIDGLQDLKFVTIGKEIEMGLPAQCFFDEVYYSNMTKSPSNVRADGKILKGPEFRAPRIGYLLERLKERQVKGECKMPSAYVNADGELEQL